MSGICGIVNFDGAPVEAKVLQQMAQAAPHRGLDGIHYWLNDHVGLAHLALNVTPESLCERQPAVCEQRHAVLTSDARIDNREDLIRTLTAKSYLSPRDPTDADLILAAYQYWGIDCPVHLLGDFAFAIWDGAQQRLFAARDAMAMRAFYYRVEPRRVLFATEVKQILAVPGVPETIFEPAIGAYLADVSAPLAWTYYDGITQLEPAHALLVDATGHRTWRYWDIDPDKQIVYPHEKEYAEHFRELFKEAVRCRLRSVKPVGLLLSGGVDSGSIASTAGWLLQQDGRIACPSFHAYCFAFEELVHCDERHISDGIVRYYNFPTTDVSAETAWPLKDYPAHGPDRDEPFIGVYQVLYEEALAVAKTNGMGMVLSGDRGDLMAGDTVFDHLGLLLAGKWRQVWDELQATRQWQELTLGHVIQHQLLRPLLTCLWPVDRASTLRRQVSRIHQGSKPISYPAWIRPEFARRVGLDDIPLLPTSYYSRIRDVARRQRYNTVFTPLHMRGVVCSERSQARFGLGFADPWSDRRIASYVLAIPQWVIQRVREPKRMVRQAMSGVVPEEVLQAMRKIIPYPLYERSLKELAKETIFSLMDDSQAEARGYINADILRNHYEMFLQGQQSERFLWSTLALEMWLRQHGSSYAETR